MIHVTVNFAPDNVYHSEMDLAPRKESTPHDVISAIKCLFPDWTSIVLTLVNERAKQKESQDG